MISKNNQIDIQIGIILSAINKVTNFVLQDVKSKAGDLMKKAPWLFIVDPRTCYELHQPHNISSHINDFIDFFLKEKKLYYFIENPILGATIKQGKFWVFFEPQIAESYFFKHMESTRKYHISKVKSLPNISMTRVFAEKIRDKILGEDERLFIRLNDIEEIIQFGERFLPSDIFNTIQQQTKDRVSKLALREITSLEKDIQSAGVSPSMLEKRLNYIYQFAYRYFLNGNDEETKNIIKKLISPQIDDRKEGLEFMKSFLI